MTTSEFIFSSLTLINTIFLAWIAWRQHKINENKFKLDLYNKRLKIFQSTMNFLISVIKNGDAAKNDIINFRMGISEYQFLFDDDVVNYIKKIRENGKLLQFANRKLLDQNMTQEKREKLVDEEETLILWFDKQSDTITTLFKPYLLFKK